MTLGQIVPRSPRQGQHECAEGVEAAEGCGDVAGDVLSVDCISLSLLLV